MLNEFAGQNAALLYKSKEPWMCTVHAHFYSILGLEIATVHSLNFDKNLEKKCFLICSQNNSTV